MPLFGLKLLSVIVERNPAFVAVLKKLKLVGILMDYFTVGHPKFNTFTVKIVKQIVASRDLELSELCSEPMLIVEKINGVMATNVMGNN